MERNVFSSEGKVLALLKQEPAIGPWRRLEIGTLRLLPIQNEL
jgi:hypothetical protein